MDPAWLLSLMPLSKADCRRSSMMVLSSRIASSTVSGLETRRLADRERRDESVTARAQALGLKGDGLLSRPPGELSAGDGCTPG